MAIVVEIKSRLTLRVRHSRPQTQNPDMQNNQSKTDGLAAVDLQPLVRKPRRKWFAHTCKDAENGWSGPHDHMEDAARAALLAWESEGDTCWIAQGRKLTKAEYEEQGAEYTWEVDTLNAIKLVLPNERS
jgi:hypothetical protein